MVLMHPYLNASFNPEVSLLEADLQNLRKVIDFAPKTNIKTGIKKFVDWYRKYYDK